MAERCVLHFYFQQKMLYAGTWLQGYITRKDVWTTKIKHTLSCFLCLKGTLEETSSCFLHLKGTLEGNASCFLHLKDILEGNAWCFLHLKGILEENAWCFLHLKDILEGISPCFFRWKGILEGTQCCIYHRFIQEALPATFSTQSAPTALMRAWIKLKWKQLFQCKVGV